MGHIGSGLKDNMGDNKQNLLSGRLLARNVIWNFLGSAAPLLVAVVAIPLLIKGMGKERFGILTLAWMVVGYFSLFDLGLGRALTKLVAERIGDGRKKEIPPLIWTSSLLLGALSLIATIIAAGISPWLVRSILKIPANLQQETLKAFYLLAFSVFFVIGSSSLRGVLQAYQRFGLINAVTVPVRIYNFLAPLLVLPFSVSLIPIVGVLVVGRMITFFVYVWLCLKTVPEILKVIKIEKRLARQLLVFGGWMSVTNIFGPFLVYLDRLMIGAMISMTAVAYYVTPYEVVTKLWIIPGAMMAVLFPAFSTSVAQDRDRTHAAIIFDRGLNYVFLLLFPLLLIIAIFAKEGLSIWVGRKFAENSSFVLQWLAIGVLINGLAQVPFNLIQGFGRPDITAKFHLMELPFYIFILWWLISGYGIKGAAIAWTIRVCVDTLLLFGVTKFIFSEALSYTLKFSKIFLPALFCIIVGIFMPGITIKIIYVVGVLFAYLLVSWKLILSNREKKMFLGIVKLNFIKG